MTETKTFLVILFAVSCHCGQDEINVYEILDQLKLEIKQQNDQIRQQNDKISIIEKQKEIQDKTQKADIERLESLLAKLKDDSSETLKMEKRILLNEFGNLPGHQKEGAMYIRWGTTTCPSNGTETVYSGYAGGSQHNQEGGAAEYVCLPQDPQYGVEISVPDFGYLYGAEYETNYFGPAQDQDVPCAVCRSTTGYSALMIPARKDCYPGWKHEYHGRLASGYHTHPSASQFVCVDAAPTVLIGGNGNDNGKLFYPVKSECGSLKCPPYHNDKEVLCAVCTR